MRPGSAAALQVGGAGLFPPHFWGGLPGTMRLNSLILALPEELLIEVLGRLDARDLAGALTTCRGLAALKEHAWRSATFRRWPKWAAIASEPSAQWRRQYELLQLREAEAGALPSVAAVRKTQQSVTERHRSILTEWLCEVRRQSGLQRRLGGRCMIGTNVLMPPLQVSFDWELESTIVFKAVAYLDHYLGEHAVEQLSR